MWSLPRHSAFSPATHSSRPPDSAAREGRGPDAITRKPSWNPPLAEGPPLGFHRALPFLHQSADLLICHFLPPPLGGETGHQKSLTHPGPTVQVCLGLRGSQDA